MRLKQRRKKIIVFSAAVMLSTTFFGGAAIYAQAPDTTNPSNVENLTSEPGDGEVLLKWDSATDNVRVSGYKIYRGTQSVKTSDDTYDLPVIPAGAVTNYIVKNLTNGQTYYFTVSALDGSGNESESYATEVSATPNAGLRLSSVEDDGKAPQVKEVRSENNITVGVVFSEPIKLPEENPESAFVIEKGLDKTKLEVQKAEIDSADETGATVTLTTAPQEKGEDYILTAGIEVNDLYDNPIISGTSDTGSFKGSVAASLPPDDKDADEAPSDTAGPTIVSGKADFDDRISVTFSEKVVLPDEAKERITIVKKGTELPLEVTNVSLSVDGETIYITTEKQEPAEYEVTVEGFSDESGNEIASEANMVTVTGKGSGLRDLVPPEDVTRLIARIKDAQKNIVELKWRASKNSAGDLGDQVLYQGDGKNSASYGAGTSLGSSTTAVEVQNLKPGNWYTFKITAQDISKNESSGAIASIFLPETGPGMIAAGLTGLIMGWYRRKKRNK